jgi:Cys-tRNA(Pro) deacylase
LVGEKNKEGYDLLCVGDALSVSLKILKEYLKRVGVDAKFFKFEEHTMTVDAAVNRLGVSREKIVKSILFIDDAGLPVLGIVTGDKRVSEKKLAVACGAKKVRRANSAEVKEFTGYDVGGVPPVGHKKHIRTFIDEKVMSFDRVIGGGGEINTLLEISPTEIKKLTNAEVKNISE